MSNNETARDKRSYCRWPEARMTVLRVRVSPHEMEAVEGAAKIMDTSISEIIRRGTLPLAGSISKLGGKP